MGAGRPGRGLGGCKCKKVKHWKKQFGPKKFCFYYSIRFDLYIHSYFVFLYFVVTSNLVETDCPLEARSGRLVIYCGLLSGLAGQASRGYNQITHKLSTQS